MPALCCGVLCCVALCCAPFHRQICRWPIRDANQQSSLSNHHGYSSGETHEDRGGRRKGHSPAGSLKSGRFHAQHIGRILGGGTGDSVVGRVEVEGPDLSLDLTVAGHDIEDAPVPLGDVQAAAVALPAVQRNHLVAVYRRSGKEGEIRDLLSVGGRGICERDASREEEGNQDEDG